MHDEMTGGTKTAISLNSQVLTILGDEGIAICSEERDPTVRMDPNSSRGAHQWPNSCFVSTKTGGSVLKGSNKGTPKHLEMGKIGYTPATDPVLITLGTLEFTH